MKILLSAYACAPAHGSEHGIGWQWAVTAHRLGHELCVLTAATHRAAITAAVAADPSLAGIAWEFPEIPLWRPRAGQEPRLERSYNLLWQIAARAAARRILTGFPADLVHHLTWGGLRAPCFLGDLGPPLVMGPLGGGEATPAHLRPYLSPRGRAGDALRNLSTATIAINPLLRPGLRQAQLIAVKTSDTANALPRKMRAKACEFLELGLAAPPESTGRISWPATPRLLFAGRLLAWKGVFLALDAFRHFLQYAPGARLTIAGSGPELPRLQRECIKAGLSSAVDFLGAVPRADMPALYDRHSALLFPSLHDSSGNVVLEALARGLPVICLDTGGPARIITRACGIAVPVGDGTGPVAPRLARACRITLYPARLTALSAGACARAASFLQAPRVAYFYAMAENTRAAIAHADRPHSAAQTGLAAMLP